MILSNCQNNRASHFVECVRNYKGQEFCDQHNNDIADIIFHAITNCKYPTTSCGLDHDDLAWKTIVSMLDDLSPKESTQ